MGINFFPFIVRLYSTLTGIRSASTTLLIIPIFCQFFQLLRQYLIAYTWNKLIDLPKSFRRFSYRVKDDKFPTSSHYGHQFSNRAIIRVFILIPHFLVTCRLLLRVIGNSFLFLQSIPLKTKLFN